MLITFKQISGSLYSPTGTLTTKVVYFLKPGQAASAELSLGETWEKYSGCYIFLSQTIINQSSFNAAIQFFLSDPSYAEAKFIWLSNPNEASGRFYGEVLKIYKTDSYKTKEVKIFDFSNLAFLVGKDGIVTLNTDKNRFEFNFDNIPKSIYLIIKRGQTRLYLVTSSLKLPLDGDQAGCLQFGISLAENNLDSLEVRLRLFIDNSSYPKFNYLNSLSYPIFNPKTNIALLANLDPLAPFNYVRTFFSFLDPEKPAKQEIQSYFCTNLGEQISLCPQPDAKLVFTPLRSAKAQDSNDPVYLVPLGKFAISVSSAVAADSPNSPAIRLLCGISGVEYLGSKNPSNNIIEFFPDQRAYASGYKEKTSDNGLNNSLSEYIELTNTAKTSWAYVWPPVNGQIDYYAQPDRAILYKNTSASNGFLPYLEVPSGTLPVASTLSGSPVSFPMFPYLGVKTNNVDNYRELELKAVNPIRHRIIYNLASSLPDTPIEKSDLKQGITPQGFLATFDNSLRHLLTLNLAQIGNQVLQLANVEDPLKSALQTNRLFLVISDPGAFLDTCSINYKLTPQSLADLQALAQLPSTVIDKLRTIKDILYTSIDDYQTSLKPLLLEEEYNQYKEALLKYGALARLSISDWDFDLSPYMWGERGTVLIFKFHEKSFLELVNNLNSWTFAEAFNSSLSQTQKWLQRFVADAQEKSKIEPDFEYFASEVVSKVNWNGILALRCYVPLTELPPQIEGLAAGINASNFYAHHLGINLTPVYYENNQVSFHDSSLFGLIYYENNSSLYSFQSDYAFKVNSLKIRFNNSQIASFSSQIALIINKLFGEPVLTKNGQSDTTTILDGSYQKHNGVESYLFISQDDNLYQLNSRVLKEIEFTKVQFTTLVPPSGLEAGEKVETRFLFSGNLHFYNLPGFDLFSFGPLYDQQGKALSAGGLNFSNLAIDMSFNPEKVSDISFNFNISQIIFDVSSSRARQNSLYNHFPLKLNQIIQVNEKATPTDLGYISIDAPLAQDTLTYPWFGLEFGLNLGSLGALAPKTDLSAKILAVWGASPTDQKVFLGIKLPGASSGKKEFDIQGFIKLTIKNIEFTISNDTSYLLKFNNIALNFFSIAFPRYGQTNLLLFGDPSGKDRETLGWYGAYVNKKE